MEEQQHTRQDLHIAGMGKSAGGIYGKVQLDGMGSIGGDLDCTSFTGNGSVSVKGSLTSRTIRIHGNGSVDGPVDALEVNIGGTAKIKSHVRCRTMSVSGRCSIHGQVTADKIEVGGCLNAENIQSGKMKVKGNFNVDGTLQAETIDIRLFDRCEAQQMNGNYIQVRKKGKRIWEQFSLSFRPARLFARVIEGNLVDVEYTEADIIRGNRVILGPGSKVRLVEYREEFIQDPTAEVGEVRLV